MKMRSGFVSNSSSSSFILIVDKKFWNEQLKSLTEEQKRTVEIFTGDEEQFRDLLIFNWGEGDMGDSIYDALHEEFDDEGEEENEDNGQDKVDEMDSWFHDFLNKLEKNKDKVKTISVDC